MNNEEVLVAYALVAGFTAAFLLIGWAICYLCAIDRHNSQSFRQENAHDALRCLQLLPLALVWPVWAVVALVHALRNTVHMAHEEERR